MSVTLADAVVFFRGDDSKLEQSMSGAQGKVGSFVGGATKLLGGALVGGATLAAGAIVGIGAAAFDVSKQTEQATAGIAASLGITTEEAEKFGEVARRVYGNNFADSVTDAGEAVGLIAQQLKLAADDPALQTMTENAFRLRDSFGVDVADSVSAVNTLMSDFGLTSDQAFNMLAKGYQSGLDRSGDFLDTIGEYSTQFSNGGASAEQFFSLMESGLQGGMLGTDKAADAFKEFRVRILDGSDATAEALDMLEGKMSINLADIENGTVSVADAFVEVTGALAQIEDPALRMQAGVGLLGTQFEDLGDEAVAALDMTKDWAAGSEGAVDSLDAKYATFGDAMTGMWRRLTVSVSPFTDKLLDLVNSAMPVVMDAFDRFDATVGPTMERTGAIINQVVGFVKGLFERDLSDGIGQGNAMFEMLRQRVDEIMPYIQTIITTVLGAISAFWTEHGDTVMAVVQNTFHVISTVIGTTLDVIMQTIKLVLQLITGDFEGAGQTLQDIANTIWDGVREVFETKLDSIRRIVGEFNLGEAGRKVVDSLRRGISDKWDELTRWFRDKLQGLRDMLPFSEPKDPASPLRNLDKAGRGIKEQIQKGLNEPFDASFLRPVATAASGAGGGGAVINVTQNFYGPTDAAAVREASENGLRSAMRRRGA